MSLLILCHPRFYMLIFRLSFFGAPFPSQSAASKCLLFRTIWIWLSVSLLPEFFCSITINLVPPINNLVKDFLHGCCGRHGLGAYPVYNQLPFPQNTISNPFVFQKPEPPIFWSGVRDTVNMAPSCIQIINNGSYVDPLEESEDCLYLNIIVPKLKNRSAKLPVMVFIHGGGLTMGNSRIFGDQGPCDNLANRGVIVVLIQYRLGLFGLLSSGDDEAKGNYAIWDQIEALKWLSRNIKAFGGDPGKVTIFGESSGAQSVSYLSYTPVAQDIFHQGIGESGSAKVAWASLQDTSVRTTWDLAKAANCTDTHSKSMLECLRRLSGADLQKIYTKYAEYKNRSALDAMPTFVAVRVDGELYTKSNLVELEKKKPSIIGVNCCIVYNLSVNYSTYPQEAITYQYCKTEIIAAELRFASGNSYTIEHLSLQSSR